MPALGLEMPRLGPLRKLGAWDLGSVAAQGICVEAFAGYTFLLPLPGTKERLPLPEHVEDCSQLGQAALLRCRT